MMVWCWSYDRVKGLLANLDEPLQKLSPVIQTSASQLMVRMSPKTLRISGLKITILRKMAMNRNNGDCDDDEDGGGEVKQASLSGG